MRLILVLFLVHQFSARACCRIWVTQPEDQLDGAVGGTIALSCQIHSDSGDEISQCHAQWYIKVLEKWREVGGLLKDRVVKDKGASTTNTTFTIKELTMNDTNTYYCTLICTINGESMQHHGGGTRINICDHECLGGKIPPANATTLPDEISLRTSVEPDSGAEDCLSPAPFYALLALKLAVVLVTVAVFATCPRSFTHQAWRNYSCVL
ncbi:hypothetical protein COCON_G00003070 [Conger conger]|uniref:Ig-like domain-containing protein n=1 Tax=Conger conger TaxID=82655 RepID=A0A9Q1E118_CONCO|nr:uncharacterized protein LOC133126558 [Conger conger]KAJ8287648.1 hypothetical protein COCON_G00003070 [Conger conger]